MNTKERKCNPVEETFVNGTSDREAHPRPWKAILVQMCTEKQTGKKLDKLGIENYIPTQTEIHQWSDRKKKIERVVIPMVIFVKIDSEEEKRLQMYSFVRKFISYPAQKEAAIIPKEQIEKLQFMLKSSDDEVRIEDLSLNVGEKIRITRGALKGLEGEISYIKEKSPVIAIRLDFLGYACANISITDIEQLK